MGFARLGFALLFVFSLVGQASAIRAVQRVVEVGGRSFNVDRVSPDTLRIGNLRVDAEGHEGVLQMRTVAVGGESLGLVQLPTLAVVVRRQGGSLVLVWRGDLRWRGDPGERVRDVFTLNDRTGDGQPDLVVGVQQSGRTLCGESETLLDTQAYDANSHQLRPVTFQRSESVV